MEKREVDERRGSSASRGYGSRWQAYRAAYLREHPLCAECESDGAITPATVVDHIIPHKGDAGLFWNPANHRALCKRCHDRKTAKEDGRWGKQTQ